MTELLSHPENLLRQVISQLDFFQFSLINPQCLKLVKEMNFKCESSWLKQNHLGQEIKLYNFGPNLHYIWRFYEPPANLSKANREELEKDFTVDIEIDGKVYKTNFYNSNLIVSLCDDYESALDTFINIAEQVFHKGIDLVMIDSSCVKNVRDSIRKRVIENASCKFLQMGEDYDDHPKTDISKEDLEWILDHVPHNVKLKIISDVGDGFVYSKPLLHNSMLFSFGKWFTRDNLLQMKCSTLELKECRLTPQDLNQFMKNWMAGNDKAFKWLFVFFEPKKIGQQEFPWIYPLPQNIPILIDGLNVKPYDRNRNVRDYHIPSGFQDFNHYQNGDIRRSDGMAATLKTSGEYFLFLAWHEK